MKEDELRKHRCCFTGHRPEKLQSDEVTIKTGLSMVIDSAIADGFTTFISGVARGVDIWAGEIIVEKRRANPAIKLIVASPYQGFEERWAREWQMRYSTVLADADLVRYICKRYSRECFQIRNEWMVDHSNRVIAVYNGEPGGTRNTIEYAKRNGISIVSCGDEGK
ncbi:MAG: SLOG family protein [Oscillospiraceae bacterium]|nr:SLOG family protein [Oscillospiraceae bacterium]